MEFDSLFSEENVILKVPDYLIDEFNKNVFI